MTADFIIVMLVHHLLTYDDDLEELLDLEDLDLDRFLSRSLLRSLRIFCQWSPNPSRWAFCLSCSDTGDADLNLS